MIKKPRRVLFNDEEIEGFIKKISELDKAYKKIFSSKNLFFSEDKYEKFYLLLKILKVLFASLLELIIQKK